MSNTTRDRTSSRGTRTAPIVSGSSGAPPVTGIAFGVYVDGGVEIDADYNRTYRPDVHYIERRCCTALAESKIRLLCWLRYVRP